MAPPWCIGTRGMSAFSGVRALRRRPPLAPAGGPRAGPRTSRRGRDWDQDWGRASIAARSPGAAGAGGGTGSGMRIAQVVESAGGGTGRHVIDLTGGLARRGHDVTLVYSPLRVEPQFLEGLARTGAEVVSAPFRRALGVHDLSHLRALGRILARRGPFDVVHGHSSKAGALVRLLPASVPGARVYTPHAIRMMDPTLSPARRSFYAALERLLARRGGTFVAGSAHEVESLRAIGVARDRIELLDFGIAPCPSAPREEARRAHGLAGRGVVMGFVGRLVRQKAPERAIRALARSGRPDVTLALVGTGELEGELRRLSVAEGVAERVVFLGFRDGQAAMSAFDVLLVPSRYDSSPYVLLEAVMAGVPIVGAPIGMAEQIVGDAGAGLLVANTDDPEPWAHAIRAMCDPARLEAARAATRRLRATRSLDHMVEQMAGIYARASAG